MSELGRVRHVLQARSHLGATGDFSFMPWTGDHPDYPYMGFKLEFLDSTEPTVYIYLAPRVDTDRPLIALYFGEHGDHTKDTFIGDIEGRQETDRDE